MKDLKKEYFKFLVVILVVIGAVAALNILSTYVLLKKTATIGFETDYRLVRRLLSLYGEIVNERIDKLSGELLNAHRKVVAELKKGAAPSLSGLRREKEDLEKKTGGVVDIAVINRRGVITETTYGPEKNLDLGKFEDVRSALKEAALSNRIRVDFPIMESQGGFYRFYTLSYLPRRKLYVQLGYKLDMLDKLSGLFASRRRDRDYATMLYNVYHDGGATCITSMAGGKQKIAPVRQRAIVKALASGDDVVVTRGEAGAFSVFKEIRLGEGRNWNNNRDYHLVMGVDLNLGDRYFLVRLSRWITVAGFAVILLIVFYGYRRLNSLLVYPLAEVSARMDESRPVAVDSLRGSCREIVAIAEAYNLHLENINIRDFARDLIAAQEEERKRIARELHDSIGQDLSLALISLEMIGRQYPETGKFTSDISKSLKKGLADIRSLIFNLDSESISRLGLVDTFADCIERFRGRAGFEIDFKVDLAADAEPEISVSSNLYRILQEALSNAARHSQARRLTVTLAREGADVVLTIVDDGIGFDLRSAGRSDGHHFGLLNMQERCRLLAGSFELQAAPGRGCRIVARIPAGEKKT